MKSIVEPARQTPVVKEVDVVVAGGGPAGVNAAVAAARNGAKTLLVERYGYLGGMITGSSVTWYLGFGNGERQVVRGLTDEFVARLGQVGGLTSERNASGDCNSDAEFVKWLSVAMLEEAGAQMLLHSWVAAAVVEGRVCKGLVVESKSGRQAILAKVVVDATADGDVCHSAGVETKTDHHDISLLFGIEGVAPKKADAFQQEDPERYERLMKQLEQQGGCVPAGQAKFEGRSAVDAEDLTYIENEARKRTFRGLLFLREHVPGYEHAKVRKTCPQLGVRESRKIVGECTMTLADVLGCHRFDDSIGRCGAQMTGYKLYDVKGLEYDVPYGCLVPKAVDGLLAAGRCISVAHDAINTFRLIVPCGLTGEAAGTAAAIAAKQSVPPRRIDVPELQARLREQGNDLG